MVVCHTYSVTHIEKRELAALQGKFKEISVRHGNPSMINRTEFREALTIIGINQNDMGNFVFCNCCKNKNIIYYFDVY